MPTHGERCYVSASKYIDVGGFHIDGVWKKQYTIICTKT
jgi:hypothetical protein